MANRPANAGSGRGLAPMGDAAASLDAAAPPPVHHDARISLPRAATNRQASSNDHTPATYVLDSRGRFSRLFMAQMAYSSVPQLGYEIAQSISALLPGHPRVQSSQSLGEINLLGPRARVTLPRAGGNVPTATVPAM